MGYDAWLEKPYQDQCALEEAVSHEIDEYFAEPEFFEDAKAWAIKKGFDPDHTPFLEDRYAESKECYQLCQERVEWKSGGDY